MRWLPLLLLAGCADRAPAAFSRESLERHIVFLASDELKGRDNDTDECRIAARYIATEFAAIGLKPAGVNGTWFHDFDTNRGTGTKAIRGRNVAGWLPGTDLAQEHIVIGAHHDARGVIDGKIQNGADDDAAGVSAVIELARAFARKPCRRSMVFVSFDAEEDGMIGSREFVKAKVHDTANCAAMFVFDCFGGNFLPWETRTVYALGSEYSQVLWDRVQRLASAEREIDVQRHGVFIIEAWDARSDYKAYRAERVPFVFLTTATPWHYHTEHDDPDVINYPKLVAATAYSERLIRETADDPARPAFVGKPKMDYVAHARSLKTGADRAAKEFTLSAEQRVSLDIAIRDLGEVIDGLADNPELKIKLALGRMFGIISVQRPK